VNDTDLSAYLDLGASFTEYPGGTAHWSFDAGANYETAEGDAAINISKATASITVNGYSGVYDAAAHGATGSARGVNDTDLSAYLDLGASFTDHPGGTAHWTFDAGPNYETANGSVQIVINNASPTLVISGADSVNEGSPYTLDLAVSDSGTDTIDHWTVNWGDGNVETVSGNPSSVSHTYADGPNTYTISATATDEDGTHSANTISVSANNIAPMLTLSGGDSVAEGSLYTLDLAASDPGADTIDHWTVNWGDGNVETVSGNPSSATHSYADGPNTYTISATATDEDGTYSANTVRVTVNAVTQTEGLVRLAADGTLEIVGTGLRDIVHVNLVGRDQIHVKARFDLPDDTTPEDENESNGDDGSLYDPSTRHFYFPASAVGSIVIQGRDGSDHLRVHNDITIPTTIDGGAGNDAIWGGGGNDTISDLIGDNRVHSGLGNDTLTVGSGNNRVWTDGGDDHVIAADGNNEVHAGRGNNVLYAGHGDNRIWTDGGVDSIIVGHGNNEIHAGGAGDVVTVGNGNNKIWLANEGDVVNAGHGNNTISGGSGMDVITVGNGNNTISGGRGDDRIITGDGNNSIDGGAGNDVIITGSGRDSIDAGAGNDVVLAGAGNDTVQGGTGNDILVGGAGDDILVGGDGRDVIIGGFGADDLTGGKDEDLLIAGWTSFDDDPAALNAVMDEWASGASHANRVAHLSGSAGGLNGTCFLRGSDVADGAGNQTVFDDNAVDRLTGSQGADWFLANTLTDNSSVKDVITDLAGNETASDIDLNNL
jgi:hypothetical protein